MARRSGIWSVLVASASCAIDAYIAEQTAQFGGVSLVPTNAIIDRMQIPAGTGTMTLARKAVALEMAARGWERDQCVSNRARSWSRPPEVQA